MLKITSCSWVLLFMIGMVLAVLFERWQRPYGLGDVDPSVKHEVLDGR